MSDTPEHDKLRKRYFASLEDPDSIKNGGVCVLEILLVLEIIERELTSMTKSRDHWRECAEKFRIANFLRDKCEADYLYEALKQEEEK